MLEYCLLVVALEALLQAETLLGHMLPVGEENLPGVLPVVDMHLVVDMPLAVDIVDMLQVVDLDTDYS